MNNTLREAKYLLGLIVPILIFVSLRYDGVWSYTIIIVAFGLIPFLELFLPSSEVNYSAEEELTVRKGKFFDWILYIQLPTLFGLLAYFLVIISKGNLGIVDFIGKVMAMGFGCGVLGINIGHELGHRSKKYEQRMAQAFLLTSLYMHFFIEHNRGHHKNIATRFDPATSRRGELIYTFFFRSITGGFLSAWHLENDRLKKKGMSVWSLKNEMVQFTLIQVVFTASIFFIFGWVAGLAFIGAAMIGALLLETVNYIEHYGLERKEVHPGVFEKTKQYHSWNSNHPLGRILLYELTRHSDHHYHAGRKYQVLRHFDDSPQMPTGYPGMMVLSFFPPLWFKVMHDRIENHQKRLVLIDNHLQPA